MRKNKIGWLNFNKKPTTRQEAQWSVKEPVYYEGYFMVTVCPDTSFHSTCERCFTMNYGLDIDKYYINWVKYPKPLIILGDNSDD